MTFTVWGKMLENYQKYVLLCSTEERKLLELHKGEGMTFLGELSFQGQATTLD